MGKKIFIKRVFCKFLFTVIISFTFLYLHFFNSCAEDIEEFFNKDSYVIVIDPGHGGNNNGTEENGYLEKEMTLKTALAMYDELSKYSNVTVYLTRESDQSLTLKQRAEIAKSVDADFLFSIHYNASVNHDLFGSECWISAFYPYNALGYDFSKIFLEDYSDFGLFIRGAKTKLNDNQKDYYGIIRESVNLQIPAVIIEHCHVDNSNDNVYLNGDASLKTFGRMDAIAVAKFLGLKSEKYNLDYSSYKETNDFSYENVASTYADMTPPDYVNLTLLDCDYDNCSIKVNVSAYDAESPIIYYSVSLDGGESFGELNIWPGSDSLRGQYDKEFELDLNIKKGSTPTVVVKAINEFDASTVSEPLTFNESFGKEKEEANTLSENKEINSNADSTFLNDNNDTPKNNKNILFLVLVIFIVILILMNYILFNLFKSKKRSSSKKHKKER